MSKIRYLFQKYRQIDRAGWDARVEQVRRRTGRSRLRIRADMAWCAWRYGAGYVDYTIFGMDQMSARERQQVLTSGKNRRYVEALNDREDGLRYFDDKAGFLRRFSAFTGREFLEITDRTSPEEVAAFLRRHPVFVAKPRDGMCGKGVEKRRADELSDAGAWLGHLRESGQALLEEVIEQHPALRALYPHAVNTVRAVTLSDGDDAQLLYACLRVGAGGGVVDNFNSGGLSVPVDPADGVVRAPALNKRGDVFERHPDTGVPFRGLRLPLWEESLALVKQAARVVPTVRYVGWDIALTPRGPVLVEGNPFPGNDIVQLYGQVSGSRGILPLFERVAPYRSLKTK